MVVTQSRREAVGDCRAAGGEAFLGEFRNSSFSCGRAHVLFTCIQFTARRTITASRFVPKPARAAIEIGDTSAPSGADLESEALYRAEAEKNMDEEEEIFNLEELIQNPTTYTWEDKYRPRKPRYFNRVHTGYEWNKYNQTHYE